MIAKATGYGNKAGNSNSLISVEVR